MTAASMVVADRGVPTSLGANGLATLGLRAWLGLLLAAHLVAAAVVVLLGRLTPSVAQAAATSQTLAWAVMVLVAAAGGRWSCRLAQRAELCRQHDAAAAGLTLGLTAVAPALAVCVIGLIALVRHPLALSEPIVVNVVPRVAATEASGSDAGLAAAVAAEPDAQRGAKLYANACAACHGDGGQGLENIGPALAATEFLGGRSDQQMIEFLQVGRSPGDADSKMGRAMPARGGNPALTDQDLADIVAHLRTLLATEGAVEVGVQAASLPRWLAPPPAEPLGGVADAYRVPTWQDIQGIDRPAHQPWHLDLYLQCLMAMIACQMALLLSTAALLLRALGDERRLGGADMGHAVIGWSLVAATALVTGVTLLAGGVS